RVPRPPRRGVAVARADRGGHQPRGVRPDGGDARAHGAQPRLVGLTGCPAPGARETRRRVVGRPAYPARPATRAPPAPGRTAQSWSTAMAFRPTPGRPP